MGTEQADAGPLHFRWYLEQMRKALGDYWRSIRQEPGKTFALALAVALALACAPASWIPQSPTTPDGLLGLEFPGTRGGALGALALLDDAASLRVTIDRAAVKRALYFDYGLIVGYAVALYLIVGWLVRRRVAIVSPNRTSLPDRFAGWAPVFAAAFDVGENLSLWGLLQLHAPYPAAGLLASLTTLCAICKFTLLVFVGLYAIRAVFSRPRPELASPAGGAPRPRPTAQSTTSSGFPRHYQEFDLSEGTPATVPERTTTESSA